MNHYSVSPQASPQAGWVVNLLLTICVLTLNFSPALAGTFNVSPVKINLFKNSSTAIITVSNAGNSDTTIQLQTMRWIQDGEGDSPSPNLAASIEVAEVVLNSLDPTVDGKPAQETNSSLAVSAPTINKTPAPIGESVEQDMDASEAATENTPSPAPFTPSSTAETKATETANRYLESLKSKWSANENGYFEVSNPF